MHLWHNQAGCLPHEQHQRQDYEIPASISSPLGQRLLFQSHKSHRERKGGDEPMDGHIVLWVRLLFQRFVEAGSPRTTWLIFRKTSETRCALTDRALMQNSSEDSGNVPPFTTRYGLKRSREAMPAGITTWPASIIQIASGDFHQSITVLEQFPMGVHFTADNSPAVSSDGMGFKTTRGRKNMAVSAVLDL